MNLEILDRYRSLLGPRYTSLQICFQHVSKRSAPIIVELGATRSFVDRGHEGVTSDDPKYWHPTDPSRWDWGAGSFSRVCAEIISNTDARLHSVDLSERAITISRVITEGLGANVMLHRQDSSAWLLAFEEPIDFLYMDHHETCEEGARLHHIDAEIIVRSGCLSEDAIVLIDDVHVRQGALAKGLERVVRSMRRQHDLHHGKGKYSIPFLRKNGFEIVYEDYQVVMRRTFAARRI